MDGVYTIVNDRREPVLAIVLHEVDGITRIEGAGIVEEVRPLSGQFVDDGDSEPPHDYDAGVRHKRSSNGDRGDGCGRIAGLCVDSQR